VFIFVAQLLSFNLFIGITIIIYYYITVLLYYYITTLLH